MSDVRISVSDLYQNFETSHQNNDTFMFENAQSLNKKKLGDIIMKNPNKTNEFLLKFPSIISYLRSFFGCSQTTIGLLLEN